MAKKAPRSSNTFPPEFLQLSMHVINTGKPITINTLGPRPEAYTTLAARYNEWRKALERERGQDDPIIQQLYALTISLTFDRSTKELLPGHTIHQAVLRRREETISAGLSQITAGLESMTSKFEKAPSRSTVVTGDSEEAAKAIGALFGGEEE